MLLQNLLDIFPTVLPLQDSYSVIISAGFDHYIVNAKPFCNPVSDTFPEYFFTLSFYDEDYRGFDSPCLRVINLINISTHVYFTTKIVYPNFEKLQYEIWKFVKYAQ